MSLALELELKRDSILVEGLQLILVEELERQRGSVLAEWLQPRMAWKMDWEMV